MMRHSLSEKWIKASIAGTIWAASEIVLGSFLHNLRVPFSGNILTAIGIIILISISYIWTERGLFWRAALLCALLKTMSPSAVIFGPMIAIFTEGLLLELSVRIFGRTIVGYALGSMLAMSWNLVQKILNYIIFYGANIIAVYSDLLKFAQKQLNITTNIVWMPIIILLTVYSLFGLLAAITGIRVGRKMLRQPAPVMPLSAGQTVTTGHQSHLEFGYSVAWLLLNIALIICSFILLNRTSWIIWSISVSAVVIVWSVRYKRALRQLSKPGFWILFVVITLLTAFLFTRSEPGENAFLKGLLTGVQMNFRAVIIIMGFSVLGTELYNPVVRNFFLRSSFRNLPLALELSAESLPLFIASIPDFRDIRKNPVSIFYQVISHADKRLAEIKGKSSDGRKILILTGSIRGGKTTFARELTGFLKKEKIRVAGILSERVMEGSSTTGYDIVNIQTGERWAFLRQGSEESMERIGRFVISQGGLESGRRILHSLAGKEKQIVIIDEVGLLELKDGGWAGCITNLLTGPSPYILMTVRDIYVEDVKKKWDLDNAEVIDISNADPVSTFKLILNYINPDVIQKQYS
jgi:nucleoside-triphosphatase THEP1